LKAEMDGSVADWSSIENATPVRMTAAAVGETPAGSY
jgi:hypothetical protein